MSGFKALDKTIFQFPGRSLILIGGNGSGKSSTLQALALVREFAHGNATRFFDDRGWKISSVNSKMAKGSIFKADLLFSARNIGHFLWQFDWGYRTKLNRRETLWHLPLGAARPFQLFDYSRNRALFRSPQGKRSFGFKIPGSIMAFMDFDRNDQAHTHFSAIVEWAQRITSLELLSPMAMRRGTRGSADDIGVSGERLASFLANLDSRSKGAVVARLKKFYPLQNIETTRKRAGWVDMRISESFAKIGTIGPSHASDGLLRLIAICAIPEFDSHASLVMLDEIEDGIEPHILPDIVRRVVADSRSQFIFTSHSPLLVNFFDSSDIHIMARMRSGAISTTAFSELSSLHEGLEYFGPGELWSMAEQRAIRRDLAKWRRSRAGSRERDVGRFSRTAAQRFMGSM